ncbi:hypothetical protein FE391_00690 [Nonomuraea sp. KC401]|uniref:hypothetical protein n=1 Tax=unclassified Nonomuraea TaxID=2593643 RepID=UPI0010FDCB8D|nr:MULTISPECIES: hypothetical protein [unclassified Nonomuraea]NBE91853.1 hypothetical protein [Nonomuraea sp. K271]TLF86446.1 hypothetical protein FE391_00690 [Nonomuraea sp. KC401]
MLIVLCSGGHSPGVTTAGLALTLAWPRTVLFAECDPAGGSVLSGFLAGQLQDRGLGEWAVQLRRSADATSTLAEQVLQLNGPDSRRILPGLASPSQVSAVQPLWRDIAETFATMSGDVIADIGRIGGADTPVPLLAVADHVLVVARPTLRDLSALAPRLATITAARGHRPSPRVLLTGDGPYGRREVAKTLDIDVVGHLPRDPKAAAVLTHGTGSEGHLLRSLLLRAARSLGTKLGEQVPAS